VNLKEIKELIRLISERGFTEFEIEREGFRMRIIRSNNPGPASQAAPPTIMPQPNTQAPIQSAPSQSTPPPEERQPEEALHIIKSPLVGTFYRSPSPNSEPFVKVGDRIEPETIVCIVEAMKLMNNIQSEISGVVAKIYAENGQPVEYGQPLFGVKT
jgi:acetyl-CoA carboxylase biotin carboxyl carrier protein